MTMGDASFFSTPRLPDFPTPSGAEHADRLPCAPRHIRIGDAGGAGMTDDIRRIAVVGAGLMGHGIALEFAAFGFAVALHDRDPGQLARARDRIGEGLARLRDL